MRGNLKLKKLKVALLFLSVILTSAAMVSSSYAWLAISRTPIVSDLDLTVMTESRLEIALDENGRPGEWELVLDLSTLLNDVVPLRPVTYSKIDDAFHTPLFGSDGRPTGYTRLLSDEANANVKGIGNPDAEEKGYYIAVTFWVRGAQNAAISLSKAVEVEEGLAGSGTYVIGNPVWDGEAQGHTNGGNGLETAVRVGFRCQDTDSEGNLIGNSRFIIYEPNSDLHADGTDGYQETSSIDGGLLIDESNLIRQTASTWNENTPVLNNSVIYSLGDFTDSSQLFRITRSSMEKVTMYVWIEYNDVDCVNKVMANPTSIMSSIQFTADNGYDDTGITRD